MRFNLKYIKINIILFFIFFLLGFIGVYLYASTLNINETSSQELIVERVHYLPILKNNLIVCGIAILGVFTFRISNVLVVVANALFLGVILGANFATTGELIYFLKIVIPHAIFELPAILLSCSIGFEGFSFFKKYTNKEKLLDILFIIILLVLAAFVEVNISTLLI